MRRLKFQPSAAEQRRRVQGALNMYAQAPVDIGAREKRERADSLPRDVAPVPLERDVLSAVRDYLRAHPSVAWVARINSGGATNESGQFVRFNSISGCSDLIGQMKSGHFLACEIKRSGERPTDPQMFFLRMVEHHGGCAGWADSIDAAEAMMKRWQNRAT